jgi:hypothetical protein
VRCSTKNEDRSVRGVGHFLATLILVVASVFAATSARAELIRDFTAPVRDIPGKTWLDLLRQMFPDIAASAASGAVADLTDMAAVHSIGSADDSWVSCRDHTDIANLEFYPLRLLDQDRLILTLSVADECAALIALFDGSGKLVDAVNVKGDQHTSLSPDFMRPLGRAGPMGPPGALVTATNWHDNSDQSYDATMLLLVKPNGFSDIGGVLAFGEHDCRSLFTEQAKIDPALGTGPMLRIDAAVMRRTQRFAADCETKIGPEAVTTFNGYWRWNAKKSAYEAHTRELDLLDKWNEKHF